MEKIAYFLYNLIAILVTILAIPLLIYKIVFGDEEWRGLKERLAFYPQVIKKNFSQEPTVWIHAASVGETGAASPVVTELKKELPEHNFLFSTMSATGQEMATKIVSAVDEFIYFPIDCPLVIRRAFKQIKPDLIVIMETELWPNFIKEADKNGAKIVVASGRISDESIDQYNYLGPILTDMLGRVDYFSMQSKLDKERIIDLGAPAKKVENNGNTKFDQDYGSTSQEAKEELYKEYKLDPAEPLIVLGSTHENEEEELLPLYQELKEQFPRLVMIIAPRYVERADELQELYEAEGIKTVKRSEIEERKPSQESVIIVDTIGELAQLYGLADLVFVGGSLIDYGGHNLLEPAAQGKLVFFGPSMYNFKDSKELLLDHEVGEEIESVESLTARMAYYLSDREKLAAKEEAARAMIEKNQGAAERNAALAASLIKEEHILCVRLSAIGDVIHALPIANAIRKAYPAAEISWIVQQKAYDLVVGNPNLDNVILLPKERWRREFKDDKKGTLKEGHQFFIELKEEYDFDLALDVHGLFKSAFTAYLSGADKIIGPRDGREGSTLFYDQQVSLPEGKIHQIERNLHLASAIGAKEDEVSFDIKISKAVKNKIKYLLADLEIEAGQDLIAINPFTSWESKDWLQERYAQLADRLRTALEARVLFTGGPSDKEGVAQIMAAMDEKAHNLAGETNLEELAELYRRLDLFIGGDTGPMHLAVAQGLKSIVLMGPTDPKTHGPYGEEHLVIQPELKCKNCWERDCPKEEHLCMEKIRVEEVFAAVRRKL